MTDDSCYSLATSMQQTVEHSNLHFVEDIGEILIDAIMDDGILKDVPILGAIAGVGKCIKNVYDIRFAKKLIAFLIPIKEVTPEQRAKAIRRWEQDSNYRGKVGDTVLGMIERCDDTLKAMWLSKLFYELVLKKNSSRLFMRAEKILSSLSVMDVQTFLNMPKDKYQRISEAECEPFIGSGLYQLPKISAPVNGKLSFNNNYCVPTEVGVQIYQILNEHSM